MIADCAPRIVRRMHELNEQPRSVLIAAVFCAIIGLIAYAGYLQRGWARTSMTDTIHRAVMAGQRAPTAAREERPDDGPRAVVKTEDARNP